MPPTTLNASGYEHRLHGNPLIEFVAEPRPRRKFRRLLAMRPPRMHPRRPTH